MKSILHTVYRSHGEVSSIIAKTSFLFNVGFNLAEIFKYVYSTLKFNNVEIFWDKDDFRPRDGYKKMFAIGGAKESFFGGLGLQTLPLYQMPMVHCKDKIPKFQNKYSQKRNIGASVPISTTFMRLWAIYIFLRSVCLFCWRKYVDRSCDYTNRSQTHECWNWGWGRAIPTKGIYIWYFRCSVVIKDGNVHLKLNIKFTKNKSIRVKFCPAV
jgi:hypothetical protein